MEYRESLVEELVTEIGRLNRDSFQVKQHLRFIDKYSSKEAWTTLGVIDVTDIKIHLAPLIIPSQEDELAKRFDYLMFTLQLASLVGSSAAYAKSNVIKTAQALSGLGTIPQVAAQAEIIKRVQTDEFWKEADLFQYEMVRVALRDLIKFIEKENSKIYYTNFTDEILYVIENEGEYTTTDLRSYKKKVDEYIRNNINHVSIHKLKTNKPLTEMDLKSLEYILWNEVGTREEYEREYGDTPLTILVRQITGLDQQAANEAFSEFLTDENLNSKQIRFVKTIVDYIVKNGHMMDKRVLQEEPFQSIGSITDLFPMERAIKNRACDRFYQ